MAVTIYQAAVVRANIATGNAEYFQAGSGWSTTPANATLYASLSAAQDVANGLLAQSGACAVPALALNNWTAR